jgi:hypothetical protein
MPTVCIFWVEMRGHLCAGFMLLARSERRLVSAQCGYMFVNGCSICFSLHYHFYFTSSVLKVLHMVAKIRLIVQIVTCSQGLCLPRVNSEHQAWSWTGLV